MIWKSRKTLALLNIALSAASVLTGYKIIRSVTDSLFLAEFGASNLPYVMMLVPPGAALAMYAFSRLLKRFGPAGAFQLTLLVSGFLFLLLYAGILWNVRGLTAVLYVTKEVYIVVLIAQHWSFINSSVTQDEGRVVNGPILGISAAGSLLAGLAVVHLPEKIGSVNMIPIAAAFTLLAMAFVQLAFTLGEEARSSEGQPKTVAQHLAFDLFRKERTVLWLSLLVALTQVVSLLFELTFLGVLQTAIPATDPRSAFLVRFWNYQDAAGIVLTFAVTPLLLWRLTLARVHFLVPAVHLCTIAAVFLRPSLGTVTAAFFIFKTLDYNLFGAAKELLYVPLSFASRYRAKQLIDGVIYRTSKGATSGVISAATSAIGSFQAALVYPPICFAALLGWILLVGRLMASLPKSAAPSEAGHRAV